MKKVFVTGHRGYIGANLVKLLAETGEYELHGYDACAYGSERNDSDKYMHRVWNSPPLMQVDHLIHLGAKISVEESTKSPQDYWDWNVRSTMNLLGHVVADHVVFASTSQVGIGNNPYTHTKEAMELYIKDVARNYHIFRFFNVAGADEFGQIGPSTHLIRIAAECAAGKRPGMKIFGTEYDTRDGTCIRDYIHVKDLVQALYRALLVKDHMYEEVKRTVRLGTGRGYSVREVIGTMQGMSPLPDYPDFPVEVADPRAGDPAELVCHPNSLTDMYLTVENDLEHMCYDAYWWELQRL